MSARAYVVYRHRGWWACARHGENGEPIGRRGYGPTSVEALCNFLDGLGPPEPPEEPPEDVSYLLESTPVDWSKWSRA